MKKELKKEKTLIRFEYCPDEGQQNCYIELEGNYSHLNKVIINGPDWEKADELMALILDEKCDLKVKGLIEPTRDWDYYITCGLFL